MAATTMLFSPLSIICFFFFLPLSQFGINAQTLMSCNFDKIYQLGDSISDTGNWIREGPNGAASPFARLPYGETFFKHATGRCSDGMLMIDFIALSAGLPFLNPYMNSNAIFKHGANFAVAGATAQSIRFNMSAPVTKTSLDVQLEWMLSHFNSICDTDGDCAREHKNTLFMVGEIGGNDYNYAFFDLKTTEEVKTMVPDVIGVIMAAVRRVIEYGAIRIVVPGNFPIGCFPIYLTIFKTNNTAAYDKFHCLKDFNHFSMYHNKMLQQAIKKLNEEYPHAIIVYGDYFNAFQWLFRNAAYLGFESSSVQKACCGVGGDYKIDLNRFCGTPEVPVCSDPRRYINWDGLHLTQEAYRILSNWLIHDILRNIQCTDSNRFVS